MSAGTDHPTDDWDATRRRVLNRDGHACRFCGTTDDEHREEHDTGLHVHHVIPRNDGGSDDPDNLLTVCCRCHRTLEETHAKAVGELECGLSEKHTALIRSHIADAKVECSWLWKDELTRLSDLPAIEDRDLPGGSYSPVNNDDLTDREKACYLLGRIQGYSHLGTHVEAVVDHTDADDIPTRILEEHNEPQGTFSTPDGVCSPEFNSGEGW